MERELAAFPAREMHSLEQSCSRKMKRLCLVELPGRRTWPGGVLFGVCQRCRSAVLGFTPCFVWGVFCMISGKSLLCLRYPLGGRDIKPYLQQRTKRAASYGCCRGDSPPPLIHCFTTPHQRPHRCCVSPFLMGYGNYPVGVSLSRVSSSCR